MAIIYPRFTASPPRLYGCHNRPRPVANETITGAPCYGEQQWPFTNSTECRYDIRETDPGCAGCKWNT